MRNLKTQHTSTFTRQFFDFETNSFPQIEWQNFLANWPDHNLMTPYSDGKNRGLKDAGRFGTYIIGYKSNDDLSKLTSSSRKVISRFTNEYLKPTIEKNCQNTPHYLKHALVLI